jgi:hypothetical protein
VLFNFFHFVNEENRSINNFFATFIKSKTNIEMEEKMKKTDSMLSFLSAEVNVNIDVVANVKIGKGGGGT